MVNISAEFCRSEAATVTDWRFFQFMIYHIISAVISLVFIGVLIRHYLPRIYFHKNVKILFYLLLALCTIHAFVVICTDGFHLHRFFFYTDPCELEFTAEMCMIARIPTTIFIFALVTVQFSLVIERCVASYLASEYEQKGSQLGMGLAVFSIVIPILLSVWIHEGQNNSDLQVYCFAYPISMYNRINTVMCLLMAVDILILLIFAGLYLREKSKNKSTYQLCLRYHCVQTFHVLQTISPFVFTNFLLMVGYMSASVVVKMFHEQVDVFTYRISLISIYLVPYSSFVLTAVLLLSFRKLARGRSLFNSTYVRPSNAESHFIELQGQWAMKTN